MMLKALFMVTWNKKLVSVAGSSRITERIDSQVNTTHNYNSKKTEIVIK